MPKRRTIGLLAFLRGDRDPSRGIAGCANYGSHYGGCLFNGTCKVEEGKRCGYFEKVVLPTAEDIGLKSCVYSLYQKHAGIEQENQLDTGSIRKCPDCRAELKKRQRYCDKCTLRHRRETYRRSRNRNNG